jgi:hypothetical protein
MKQKNAPARLQPGTEAYQCKLHGNDSKTGINFPTQSDRDNALEELARKWVRMGICLTPKEAKCLLLKGIRDA